MGALQGTLHEAAGHIIWEHSRAHYMGEAGHITIGTQQGTLQ